MCEAQSEKRSLEHVAQLPIVCLQAESDIVFCSHYSYSSHGLTAFDAKRRLYEVTVDIHSHGHKDTMSDPEYMDLVNKCCDVECVTNAGVFDRSDLPGPSLSARLESDSDLGSDPDSDPQSPY